MIVDRGRLLPSSFGVMLSGLMFCATALGAEPDPATHFWYEPVLTESHDRICASLLSDARRIFKSSEAWSDFNGTGDRFRGLTRIDLDRRGALDPIVEPDAERYGRYTLRKPDGSGIVVDFCTNIGCGGGCDSLQVDIIDPASDAPNDTPGRSTPPAPEWTLYKTRRHEPHVMGIVDDHLQLYRADTQAWALSCDIALGPSSLRDSEDADIREVVGTIDRLNAASRVMAGEKGDCGSLRTRSRWRGYVDHALNLSLYRPWVLDWPPSGSENSGGDYSRIEKQLYQWSLGGLFEHRALADYGSKLEIAEARLARFYQERFRWSPEEAARVAHMALTHAISLGFGFYMYEPFSDSAEMELRAAILEHRPIDQIRMMRLDPAKIDRPYHDSILNIAVRYPAALRYLIERGLNPDQANGFGKTPLMYAAQEDQMEAVRILLDAGANPNASTMRPSDTCSHTVQTSGVTPLHYAARYGSPALIALLVERGSRTFLAADGREEVYPRDWLALNTGMDEADRIALAELMRVPAPEERAAIASALLAQAADASGDSEPQAAYRGLRIAHAAKPDDEEILSDLSRAALTAGEPGAAIEAARRLIFTSKTPSVLATAWFNIGLACEQPRPYPLIYNGEYHCLGGHVRPFFRAWRIQPTRERTHKLRQLLESEGQHTCKVARPGGGTEYFRFSTDRDFDESRYKQVPRIYALHAAGDRIPATAIEWIVIRFLEGRTVVNPEVKEELPLGWTDAVTVFESPYSGGKLTIYGQTCDLK